MSNPNPNIATRFQPGNLANPGGKPVNARNKLNATFLRELSDAFEEVGRSAIYDVARNDPSTFIRVMAALQPKEMEIKRSLDDVTDEQLDAAAVAIRAILDAQNHRKPEAIEGESEQTQTLLPVPETN